MTTTPSPAIAAAAVAAPAPTARSTAPATAPATPRRGRAPGIAIGAVVLAVAAAAGGRLWWWSTHFAETDNATVAGHVHPVSARLAGVVTRVDAQDNAAVKAGAALLVLDATDQQAQVERLQAQIAQVDAQIAGSGAQVAQARAQVAAAQAQAAQAGALLARAERDTARAQRLYDGELRAVSKQELDAAIATRDAGAADLAARRAAAVAASETVAGAQAARAAAVAQRAVLQAQLKDARQQMAYATVVAPSDGRIGKRTVEVGQRVQPGQQLLAVVEPGVWITANFKETQLARMHPGQRAEVHVDAVPGRTLHATVDSFAPASGASFALLPPDNATGNFTKVVQRVPVKLRLDEADAQALGDRLVPGLSAVVTVDLRD